MLTPVQDVLAAFLQCFIAYVNSVHANAEEGYNEAADATDIAKLAAFLPTLYAVLSSNKPAQDIAVGQLDDMLGELDSNVRDYFVHAFHVIELYGWGELDGSEMQ